VAERLCACPVNRFHLSSNLSAGSINAPFVYRRVCHVLSVERAVRFRYGVLIIVWGSLVSRDLRAVEIIGSNPIAVTFVQGAHLGVVKLGITRRLGRRDRWFESSHLDLGATSQLAMAPVSKTDELNGLRSSTLLRSALEGVRL
jgi:hypothetical protein